MNLRQLLENKSSNVGVCFGRWNPPHQGHKAAWETAAQFDHYYVGTNKNTEGPKDPLPYNVKLKCMQAIWPEIAGHVIPEQSLFTLVSKVYAKHGEHTHLKVCTDEDWLTKSLMQYNGVEGAHGFYKFASIEQVPTPRLSSATALRAAVRAGDKEAFAEAAGVDANTPIHIGKRSKGFFDVVAHYLAKHPEPVKRTKAVAEERMSARVKLQRAWEREQAKSTASRDRAEKAKAEFEKEWKAKQQKDNLTKDEVHERFLDNLTNALLDEAKGKGGMKPIDKEKKAAMKNATTLPGLNMATGSMYMNYRMGIALAGAPDFPTKMEADNWIGGDPLISSYTQEEFEMVKAAAAQVGAGTIQNWSGDRSKEVADVNKTSTTAKVKRNKYGV